LGEKGLIAHVHTDLRTIGSWTRQSRNSAQQHEEPNDA
jgi:hypothetical protein